MDNCKHRWADSPSDAGEGIYCTRCGDMANVTQLREQIAELRALLEERATAVDNCLKQIADLKKDNQLLRANNERLTRWVQDTARYGYIRFIGNEGD